MASRNETVAPTDVEKEADAKTSRSSIMVGMPAEMKALVQDAAKAKGTSTQDFVRTLLAQTVNFTGALTKGRVAIRKYASEEERKAATKERNKQRRELFKVLLAKYEEEQKVASGDGVEAATE